MVRKTRSASPFNQNVRYNRPSDKAPRTRQEARSAASVRTSEIGMCFNVLASSSQRGIGQTRHLRNSFDTEREKRTNHNAPSKMATQRAYRHQDMPRKQVGNRPTQSRHQRNTGKEQSRLSSTTKLTWCEERIQLFKPDSAEHSRSTPCYVTTANLDVRSQNPI